MNLVASWICKIFLKPFVGKFLIKDFKGKNFIPKNVNFILASNHQSHLDWLPSGYICVPRRFTFLGQVDRYKGLSALARSFLYFIAGVIPVNRKSDESKKSSLIRTVKAIKDGNIIIIYPEGTRSRTEKIGKGKLGIAALVIKTGVLVLPVGIKGTFGLLPPGGKLKIEKKVKINIGPPLYFKEEIKESKNIKEGSEEYKKILIKITDKMMASIAELKEEIL